MIYDKIRIDPDYLNTFIEKNNIKVQDTYA